MIPSFTHTSLHNNFKFLLFYVRDSVDVILLQTRLDGIIEPLLLAFFDFLNYLHPIKDRASFYLTPNHFLKRSNTQLLILMGTCTRYWYQGTIPPIGNCCCELTLSVLLYLKQQIVSAMKEFIGTFTVFFTVSFLHSSMASSSHLGSFASFFKHPTSRLIKSKVNRAIRPIYSSSNPLFIKRIRGGQRSDIDINTNLPKISIEKIDNTTIAKVDIPMNFAFSDVDGTLVHYPSENESTEGNDIIHLPPSSTGLKGVISAKTLKLCQILRHEQNVKLVLVSGMRTSTLLKRLPYLPKADAYAPEAGGRIFYPVTDLKDYSGTLVEPVHFNGASEEDVKAFGIVEDMDWREKLSQDQAAGGDGYIGDVMNTFLKVEQEEDNQVKPIKDRESSLWNFAKSLEAEGFVIDYKGYTCCFRVNRKQQDKEKISDDDFNKLSLRNVEKLGLASSVNLGCVDFYPIKSGKKNW
jgi:hydroxymethylpyrimidine pyrophosphatase-like HAD family hydrolase